jgi:hypothetical protein
VPIALLKLTLLSETSSTEILVAEVLAVFIDIIKPRLIASEASHRLAPIEGHKELARRLESRAEKTKMEEK